MVRREHHQGAARRLAAGSGLSFGKALPAIPYSAGELFEERGGVKLCILLGKAQDLGFVLGHHRGIPLLASACDPRPDSSTNGLC